jgi:transglutaminase-like putative cysteine protease
MSAFYHVEHLTRYSYAATVSTSQHVVYLRPREHARQRVYRHALRVDPEPERFTGRTDYFGNTVAQFMLLKPHDELRVTASSMVEVLPNARKPDVNASPPWKQVSASLRYRKGSSVAPEEAARFAYASPYVTCDGELADYARTSFAAERPLLDAALDLTHRIHAEFRFDAKATTIATPTKRVLTERRGVCQDFAHLQLGCLRSLGLAARYVSGYLLTDPPPGQPRLIGADASHAWISVYCPVNGWVDLDPTNDVIPELRHVTLAWGRDYGDVSPLRGVILGSAQHKLEVGVSVIPLEEGEREDVMRASRSA